MIVLTRKTSLWLTVSICTPSSWIFLAGDIIYDCWKCIYEPLFWLMYLFSCILESHHQQKERYFDDMMIFSADDDGFHIIEATVSSVISSPTNKNDIENINKCKTNEGAVRTFRYSKLYIKRTLKSHFKSIRQKQRLLNGMLKHSLLRRARKVILTQKPSPGELSKSKMVPLFLSAKSMTDNGKFYPSPSPLPPMKTLIHQGKLAPEIVSLSKSMIFV